MSAIEWRPVVGFEGYYQVSNTGLVKSLDRYVMNNGGYQFKPERIMKPATQKKGHLSLILRVNGRDRSCLVHHLILEAFVGPRPPGLDGCHNDGNPANNHIDNLRWDTKSSNNFDSVRHGTHPQAKNTSCPQGHEFTPENVYHERRGELYVRRCRKCRTNIAKRRWQQHLQVVAS